jgi:hypothetical protein
MLRDGISAKERLKPLKNRDDLIRALFVFGSGLTIISLIQLFK